MGAVAVDKENKERTCCITRSSKQTGLLMALPTIKIDRRDGGADQLNSVTTLALQEVFLN